MIGQTSPAGITIGPILGPRTPTGLQTQSVSPEPLFRGQQLALQKVRQKELSEQREEARRQQFIKSQQQLYKSTLAQSGAKELIDGSGLNINPFTAKGREALNRMNQYNAELQQGLYNVMAKATDSGGKMDIDTAARDSALLQTKLSEKIINDPFIVEAGRVAQDKNRFNSIIENARKNKNLFVDEGGALNALREADDYLNDVNGDKSYTSAIFNPNNLVYNEAEMQSRADELIATAVGETELVETVNAAMLEGAPNGIDGLISQNVNVQNERNTALNIAQNLIQNDERLASFIRAKGHSSPQDFFASKVNGLLRQDDMRKIVTEREGIKDANINLRESEKKDGKGSKSNVTYGIEGNTQKDKELRGYLEDFAAQGMEVLPNRGQMQSVLEDIDRYNKKLKEEESDAPQMSIKHLQIDDKGNLVLRLPTETGELGEVFESYDEPRGVVASLSALPKMDLTSENIFVDSAALGYSPNSITRGGSGDRGFRHKNPLNYFGDGRGKVYDTFAEGFTAGLSDIRVKVAGRSPALEKNMKQRSRSGQTPMVADLIETWSPRYKYGGDNPDNVVDNYIDYVGNVLQIDPYDTPLSTFAGKEQRLGLAMASMESPDSYITLLKQMEGTLTDDERLVPPRITSPTPLASFATPESPSVAGGEIVTEQAQLNSQIEDFVLQTDVDTLPLPTEVKKEVEEFKKLAQNKTKGSASARLKAKKKLGDIPQILNDPNLRLAYLQQNTPPELIQTTFGDTINQQFEKIGDEGSFVYDLPRLNSDRSTSVTFTNVDGKYYAEYIHPIGKREVEIVGDTAQEVSRKLIEDGHVRYPVDVYDKALDFALQSTQSSDSQSDQPQEITTDNPFLNQ